MVFKFNDDGSLSVPKGFEKELVDSDKIFEDEAAVKILKRQVSTVNPLRCELDLSCSSKVSDPDLIESLFVKATGKFKHMAQLSIKKLSDANFKAVIISGQFRCSWCENFIDFLGSEMDCKIINETSCASFKKS